MMKRFLFITISVFLCYSLGAQKKKAQQTLIKEIDSITRIYNDTLNAIYNHYFAEDSLICDTMSEKSFALSPDYYRLFVPFTYYYSPFTQITKVDWHPKELKIKDYPINKLFPIDSKLFNRTERIDKWTNKILLKTYISHPELVVATEEQISKRKLFKKEIVRELPPKIKVIELFEPEPIDTNVGEMDLFIRKPNFWTIGGNGSLQFTQNFISENWYKGGESTNSMLSYLLLTANYDDKQKIEFDNNLEIKLGFITAPSDTVHKYKTNSDLFRFTSKLGVKAIARWYYTISAEFNTQFFANYKTNTNDKITAFMSPANLVFSVGMDYKLNKKKANLSVFISPLAYNFRYIADKDVDPTAFGIEEGKQTLHDFGSKFQTNLTWKIISSIIWESRLYYFTNYKKVEAEWENTINFVLNRYLSTKLFVHARFDDGVKPVNDHSYFQLKELLSFGINYKW